MLVDLWLKNVRMAVQQKLAQRLVGRRSGTVSFMSN